MLLCLSILSSRAKLFLSLALIWLVLTFYGRINTTTISTANFSVINSFHYKIQQKYFYEDRNSMHTHFKVEPHSNAIVCLIPFISHVLLFCFFSSVGSPCFGKHQIFISFMCVFAFVCCLIFAFIAINLVS